MNTAIAAGYAHTCAITGGGVRCWGSQDAGENADVTGVSGLTSGVSAIAAGEFHTCALTDGGGVKCWGSNDAGQLGDGTTADSSIPVDVVGLSSGVYAIGAGGSHSCALTSSDAVRCWGANLYGGLGNGTRIDSSVPVDVSGLSSGISAIAVGGLHTCALMMNGSVSCWGEGTSRDPELSWSTVPVGVPDLTSGVRAIVAGSDQTCALTMFGGITCWGLDFGAPGGDLPTTAIALDVSGLSSGVAAIATGGGNVCALTNGGGVACWGDNSYGQLGTSTLTDGSHVLPVEVVGLGGGVAGVAVGAMHACALTLSGEGRCWGSDRHGQLGGVSRCSSTSVPVDVPLAGAAAAPPASDKPQVIPVGRIGYATGATDVVLRYDRRPDFAVGDLVGELFQPGPEFTLYGNGTVIFRNDGSRPPADGPILRGRPFRIGQLDEDQVQSLLRFALGEGGLGNACERYETQDTDVASVDVVTIRAGGSDKRITNFGSAPFEALYDRLHDVAAEAGIPTRVWVPDRYHGNLLPASIFKNIGDGVTPGLAETGTVPWPWPGISPADFLGLSDFTPGRRVMSGDEAAALGLSDKGGVVQRVYLLGPDGESIYYFSLWPMQPDDPATGSQV